MQKISRIGLGIFLILNLLFQLPSLAQSKKYFVITGKIVPEAEGTGNGTIEVTKNEKETTNIDIPKNGRFRFELEFFNEYSLTFKYPGHFNKIIIVSTEIPQEVWQRDNDFPPFPMIVQLAKEFEGIDKSFTLKPSGRIFYGKDIDNFEKESYISDLQFTEQVATAKNQASQVAKEAASITKENAQDLAAKQKNFDQIIKEADTYYQKGEYQMALMKYLEAHNLFPEKAYPNDRVAELQDLVKALEITEKQKTELEQKYKTAIAKANGFFDQKSYKEARPVYEEALQYKPGDVFSNGRINEIDQLLALLEKQNQFKSLIANADNNYKSKNYDQAITLYNQAKQLVPEDQYPQNQIDLINQEKQKQAQLDQLEKDFDQTLKAANNQVLQKDYLQALNTYKKALGLKPDSQLAKDKIAETELAIVAVENDKKYLQAIQLADQALAKNDLPTAKMQYQEALKIKSEAYPKTKLAEIAASESKEIDFNNLVAKAEKAYADNNFDEALNTFTEALKLKPADSTVKKRIEDIQNLKNKELAEKEYAGLIAQADQNFNANQFDDAIAAYDKALQLKKSETYPKNQLKKIDTYQSLLKKADKSFLAKDYAGSLLLFNNILEVKPKDNYVASKIDEIQKIQADQKQQEEKAQSELLAYNEAIKVADQLFTTQSYTESLNKYREALAIKAAETYPQKRIKEIESILDKAEKEKVRIESEYKAAIAQGDKNFEAKDYSSSLASFNKALELKPNDNYATTKIAKIQKIQLEQKQLEEKAKAEMLAYNEVIKVADQLFTAKSYPESLGKYKEALAIKTAEAYPQKRITEIESILDKAEKEKARIESEYKAAIAQGDKNFEAKDYSSSLASFNKALELKSNDNYATTKIAEIQKIQLEQKQLEEKAKAEMLAYNEVIKVADQLFTAKSYPESLGKYKEALAIKTAEAYPQKRITEIESILDGIEKEKARIENEYKASITLADNLFEKKDYANAQAEYRKALTIKADQVYPKDQIRKIDETLAENRRREEENQKQQLEKQNVAFNQAMANADKSFNENDFNSAKTGYETALTIKPNDPVAKEKYGLTEGKIAQIARNTQAYNKAITEANNRLTAKQYPEAREKYMESLQYMPDSDYPKQQVAKIDELLAQQQAEAKTRSDFDQAVAEGESLYKNKDLLKAKDAFIKAYNLIPSEAVPPKRISEINNLIAEQERNNAALKATLEAYQKVIQRADNHFGNKEYGSAQLAYNEALLVKPDEKYPEDQLALIAKLLKEQNEQNYKTAIAKADNSFTANQLDDAATNYQEALKYKKDDQYATQKLKDIEKKKADIEAENNRLKQFEDQYKSLIADANNDFKNKSYAVAKEKYQKALTLKPAEVYPKDQIAKIDELLNELQKANEKDKQYAQFIQDAQDAFQANKLKDARALYQKGYNLKPFEPLPPMRIAEIDRMLAQQEETAKLAAQEEAQRLAKEKADKEQYNNAVAAGDKEFAAKQYKLAKVHYTDALTALSNEKYPRDQIAKIDDLLAQEAMNKSLAEQKAQQDSIQKAKDKLFDTTMLAAKDHDQNKRYEQAIQKYNEAISIKPDQRQVIQKYISDIQDKMQLLAKQDAEYKRLIKLADGYFTEQKLNEALAEYQNALKIKPDEEYPKNQIKEIQSQLAAREQNYANAIARADKAYDASDWVNAKTGYTEALSVKPDESYPANRLKEVNQKIADANLAAASNSATNKAYAEAMEKAEKALKDDQLSSAKMQFQMAQSIKPDEKLPAQRIKEIDVLIDQRNKDRLSSAQRELDEKYRQALSVADNSYHEKSYSIAKLQYQQALLIKPEESYPKTQMALMDKLMNEAKPAETYVMNLPKTETTAPATKPIYNPQESAQATEARAQKYNTITDYDETIKKADDLFGVKDYSVARFYYSKATEIKPSEEYPKKQIDLIEKLIDSQLSDADLSEYNNAITQADNAFASKNYQIAKFFYYKALGIKSWEKYPKDRINEILALTNSLLSEKEEKEYKNIIAKADEAYFNKDLPISRFYYNKALSIKKDENYPRIKLKDIQKLIDQDSHDQATEQYRNLIEQGDQALQLKNYSVARFNYNKALTMKPDEKYPKEQLKKIKEALQTQNN
jgi:tetratricopeptide (TPR) repeat protein